MNVAAFCAVLVRSARPSEVRERSSRAVMMYLKPLVGGMNITSIYTFCQSMVGVETINGVSFFCASDLAGVTGTDVQFHVCTEMRLEEANTDGFPYRLLSTMAKSFERGGEHLKTLFRRKDNLEWLV